MDLIDGFKAFVATAQTGSFTAAGERLGISNRLASKYVADLETRLGVRLFQRTTRKVGLTPAGEDLLTRAPALVDDVDDIVAMMTEDAHGFSGTLRIAAPLTLGEIYVDRMLGRFAAGHPGITIDLHLSDATTDLATEGIDLAFRVGTTSTLSVKALKLGEVSARIAASPDYLARHGTPEIPRDLSGHICIADTNRRGPTPWRWVLSSNGQRIEVDVSGRLLVNSARSARNLAVAGHGIVFLPRFAICDALQTGELVPLLEDYTHDTGTLSAIYLEGRALPRKVRALIEFAREDVRKADIF